MGTAMGTSQAATRTGAPALWRLRLWQVRRRGHRDGGGLGAFWQEGPSTGCALVALRCHALQHSPFTPKMVLLLAAINESAPCPPSLTRPYLAACRGCSGACGGGGGGGGGEALAAVHCIKRGGAPGACVRGAAPHQRGQAGHGAGAAGTAGASRGWGGQARACARARRVCVCEGLAGDVEICGEPRRVLRACWLCACYPAWVGAGTGWHGEHAVGRAAKLDCAKPAALRPAC